MFQMVGFDLSDMTYRPVVTATLLAPHQLLSPISFWDNCVGAIIEPFTCENMNASTRPTLHRIEDGPVFSGRLEDWRAAYAETVVTLTAFVVNIEAPSTLSDLDGDGIVGPVDAELAGYQVISDTRRYRFSHLRDELDRGEIFTDLDGNGLAMGADTLPGGPGSVVPIPR